MAEPVAGLAPDPIADAPAPLVDPAISRGKLEAQLADWRANENAYRRRGWQLLRQDELEAEVAFAATVPVGQITMPIITACVRLRFENYDLWAPSVTFIDYTTGEPRPPAIPALSFEQGQPQNVVLDRHPDTGLPFLCLPGTREYHSHHEHTGDDWLLYRSRGYGTLAALCEEIWQRMVRTILGLRAQLEQSVVLGAGPGGSDARIDGGQIALIQGDPAALQQQIADAAAQQAAQQAQPGVGPVGLFRRLRKDPKTRKPVAVGGSGPLAPVTDYVIAVEVMDKTLAAVAEAGEGGDELFVAWGAELQEDGACACFDTVIVPEQECVHTPQGLLVLIEDEALFSLNKSMHTAGRILAGQAHAHPGRAFHSPADDELALTGFPGALSLVLPDFARAGLAGRRHWRFYRREQSGLWQRLDHARVAIA